MAIKEWADLADRADVSLERSLAAFDMFVLHDREGDFDEVFLCINLGMLSLSNYRFRSLATWMISHNGSTLNIRTLRSKALVKRPSLLRSTFELIT